MKHKKYNSRYPLTTRELSPDDANQIVGGIQKHLETRAFLTQVLPVSLVLLAIITFFLLR